MIRVAIIVEGQTEESFVKGPLAEALWYSSVSATPILLGKPGHKGGRTNYARVKSDVLRQLKNDPAAYCSTMLDYSGLGKGFPGASEIAAGPNRDKVLGIEKAMSEDVNLEIPDYRPDLRFIPYLQLHEYEGLLFSDPQALAVAIGEPGLAQRFQAIREGFPTPEDINDDPAKFPSKRILTLYPSYSKVIQGVGAARAVSIDTMRRECPHFREWLERLCGLGL
ncbi:MAG: DUF4276 family protein [Bryobacteraceae bacterium]